MYFITTIETKKGDIKDTRWVGYFKTFEEAEQLVNDIKTEDNTTTELSIIEKYTNNIEEISIAILLSLSIKLRKESWLFLRFSTSIESKYWDVSKVKKTGFIEWSFISGTLLKIMG